MPAMPSHELSIRSYHDRPKRGRLARSQSCILQDNLRVGTTLTGPPTTGGAERALRDVAVGRSHYLLAEAHYEGERAATIYSLIGTAKLYGVDHAVNRVDEFLPCRLLRAQLKTVLSGRLPQMSDAGWSSIQELLQKAQARSQKDKPTK